MSAVHLLRLDPAKNMRRFYRLDVQPDLFGGVSLVREWGRIGRAGRLRLDPYPTSDDAQAALERQRRAKERCGYEKSVSYDTDFGDAATIARL
jgi:predicted DNA-binding WGR domain protein